MCHYFYVSWPDFGVPKSASAMLDFREHVLQRREAAVQSLGSSWTGPPGGPPVVVHCSAGIGRTGKHAYHFGVQMYIYNAFSGHFIRYTVSLYLYIFLSYVIFVLAYNEGWVSFNILGTSRSVPI